MSRGSLLVPLVVFLATCSTCVGSMRWQARRMTFEGQLPQVFYVLTQTPEGPKALNLTTDHTDVRSGAYALPDGTKALRERQEIDAAATSLSRPGEAVVLKIEAFEPGPPLRLSMMFNYDDFGYRTEYEVLPDGLVRPLASSSVVKRMGVNAFFWTLISAIVSWVGTRVVLARRLHRATPAKS